MTTTGTNHQTHDLMSIVNHHYQKRFKKTPSWKYAVDKSDNSMIIGTIENCEIVSEPRHTKREVNYDMCKQYIAKYNVPLDSDVQKYLESQKSSSDNRFVVKTKNVFYWIHTGYKELIDHFYLNDSPRLRYYLSIAFTHSLEEVNLTALKSFIGDNDVKINLRDYKPLATIGKTCITSFLSVSRLSEHSTSKMYHLPSGDISYYVRECTTPEHIRTLLRPLKFETYVMCTNELAIEKTTVWTEFFYSFIGGVYMGCSYDLQYQAKTINRILVDLFGSVNDNLHRIEKQKLGGLESTFSLTSTSTTITTTTKENTHSDTITKL